MNIEQVIALAEAYHEHTGLKFSSISSYATNDGKWLRNLRSGVAGCTVRRAAAVGIWFSTNWPADLAWPADIPRPPKSKEAA